MMTHSELLNVALDSSPLLVLTGDLGVGKGTAFNNLLRVTVSELDGRATQ